MTRARCSNHKTNKQLPRGCKTCMRIQLEATIVKRTVRALLAAGYALKTDASEDMDWTTSATTILAEMMETDDEHLLVQRTNVETSWVRFVYGNDGWDVINDYTTDLETVLKPVNDYADRMGG